MYKTQDNAESYYDKIKSSSNVMSLREQVKLILQWKVFQRSNIVANQYNLNNIISCFLLQIVIWCDSVYFGAADWRKFYWVILHFS